jgi:CheY-like chemotaxis protein
MEQLVVLIADDNEINIRVLENRVRKMGHVVYVSRDGQECFERFVENHHLVDFILMDINVSVNAQAVSY